MKETVEQFLARGGIIKKQLLGTKSSRPLFDFYEKVLIELEDALESLNDDNEISGETK